MAATSHPLSTLSAINVLQAGGNAVDAAVAACAVQCVVEPGSTGIGGDCFMLYCPGGSDQVIAYNGSGRAAAGYSPEWFRQQGLDSIARQSPHAVTVPGAIEAWGRICTDWGSWDLDRILGDAIRYAEHGYAVASRVQRDWRLVESILARDPGSRDIYLPGGVVPAIGSRQRNARLAATLRRIAAQGPSAFYEGDIARRLVAFLRNRGGLHTEEDFATAAGEYVIPVSSDFEDYRVWECPPNGQGVIALLMLNILKQFRTDGDALAPQRLHLEIEAARLAYAQRDLFLGDPQHTGDGLEWMLTEEQAKRLAAQINPERATPRLPDFDLPTSSNTVYVSVVDRNRNAVSFINSLFDEFGSGLTEPETGVLFHNRGQGFSLEAGHPNAIAPRKRPLHTLIPGMLTRAGRACMPFGVMGGHYQSLGHVQFLGRLLQCGHDLQECADLPRLFPCLGSDEVEIESGMPAEVVAQLRHRGHQAVGASEPLGGAQAIWIDWDNGVLTGASDPRKDGCALGY